MKRSFESIVDEVLEKYKHTSQQTRNDIINEVCETYVMEKNKKPDSFQLSRLANLVLEDDIRNTDSYKVQNEPYPFLSEQQSRRRKKKEFVALDTTLEFMSYKAKAKLSTAPPKDNR